MDGTAITRAEALRISDHRAALAAMRALAAPLEPPDPVMVIDAKIAQLVDVFNRPWEEFDTEATLLAAEAAAVLRDARAVSVAVWGERR